MFKSQKIEDPFFVFFAFFVFLTKEMGKRERERVRVRERAEGGGGEGDYIVGFPKISRYLFRDKYLDICCR